VIQENDVAASLISVGASGSVRVEGNVLGISLGAVNLKTEARWRKPQPTGRGAAGLEHAGGAEGAVSW
jgi:hypothetical protein